MNPALQHLHPYPFEKLNKLFADVTPPDREQILWSIGEPKHPVPERIARTLEEHSFSLGTYPAIAGSGDLRSAIAAWIDRRFLGGSGCDPDRHVLPVNGTREALFSFAHCVVQPAPDALVLMPNPFYQIYEGAALLAGATPWFLNLVEESGYLPDFSSVPDHVWNKCQLVYICTPGNPAGAIIPRTQLQQLIELADKHDFVIASDECYSELYFDEASPGVGLLQAALAMNRPDFDRCVVFHSLSKRSSVPGLRSGFVAGDPEIIKKYRHYRTYHGCSMSPPLQLASISAWTDEEHVRQNRELYRKKFAAVLEILAPINARAKQASLCGAEASGQSKELPGKTGELPARMLATSQPDGGFYLWTRVPGEDTDFAKALYKQQNMIVLPGSYLSRTVNDLTPGHGYVRMALVAPMEQCIEGANRLKDFMEEYRP